MKRFILKTQGCKSNQLESAVIKERLEEAGFVQCSNIQDADIYILNSCSVTQNADIEALRFLRNAKNKNKHLITVLTGCSAQLHSDELVEHEYIDFVAGNDDKFDLLNIINSGKSLVSDIHSVNHFNNQFIKLYNNTRGYLKIQDGCNNYCSYCTIPLARGNSRSNSIDNILEQIKIFTDSGIKEIVLTGIHIGQWGADFQKPARLMNLLEEIENTAVVTYRLGSLNTLELDDCILNFLSQSKKFCPHFHLSIQSLTNKTLSAMNRHYTAEDCLDLIEKIDSMFNLPFIGSDIIAGFPGETDEDFEITLNNAINSKLSNIHVFPYSPRNNTPAAKMDNQVPADIKHERADLLKKIAQQKLQVFINRNISTETQILVEKRPDKKTGLLKGITGNYLSVYIDSKDKSLCNTIQNVKILNRKDEKLFCNIIE